MRVERITETITAIATVLTCPFIHFTSLDSKSILALVQDFGSPSVFKT
jgi:hypothetical protein